MEPWQMNPYIRYMDRRTCSISYREMISAYDYRLFSLYGGGDCTLLIDGQALSLNKDSCIVFPPAMPYRFLFSEQNPTSLYVVNFNLSFTRTAALSLSPDVPDQFDPSRMPCPPDDNLFVRPLVIEDAADLVRDTGDLFIEWERCASYRDELCSSMLRSILLHALRRNSSSTSPPAPEPVQSVMQYLSEHCCEKIDAAELGKLFGYHPYYLNSLFREHTGCTLHRYQTRLLHAALHPSEHPRNCRIIGVCVSRLLL